MVLKDRGLLSSCFVDYAGRKPTREELDKVLLMFTAAEPEIYSNAEALKALKGIFLVITKEPEQQRRRFDDKHHRARKRFGG